MSQLLLTFHPQVVMILENNLLLFFDSSLQLKALHLNAGKPQSLRLKKRRKKEKKQGSTLSKTKQMAVWLCPYLGHITFVYLSFLIKKKEKS